jgi:hypothetical protein
VKMSWEPAYPIGNDRYRYFPWGKEGGQLKIRHPGAPHSLAGINSSYHLFKQSFMTFAARLSTYSTNAPCGSWTTCLGTRFAAKRFIAAGSESLSLGRTTHSVSHDIIKKIVQDPITPITPPLGVRSQISGPTQHSTVQAPWSRLRIHDAFRTPADNGNCL